MEYITGILRQLFLQKSVPQAFMADKPTKNSEVHKAAAALQGFCRKSRLIIVGKEDNQWKIVEVSDAPVESLENTDYAFNSSSEKAALNIINERLQGNIVKGEGNVLS